MHTDVPRLDARYHDLDKRVNGYLSDELPRWRNRDVCASVPTHQVSTKLTHPGYPRATERPGADAIAWSSYARRSLPFPGDLDPARRPATGLAATGRGPLTTIRGGVLLGPVADSSRFTDRPSDPIAFVVEDIAHSLERSRMGRITVTFAGGSFEITTDGMAWCAEVSDEELRSFADRLALVAEDPRILLGATGSGDFLTVPTARQELRGFSVSHFGETDPE